MHEGHRQRMYDRLENGETMEEHEILEMLLYNAIPRRNTNELAHAMIDEFGSLDKVLAADMETLARFRGIGRATAAYIHLFSMLCGRGPRRERPPIVRVINAHELTEFAYSRIGELTEEVIEAYCLDPEGQVRYCKRFPPGSFQAASIPAEEISELLVFEQPNSLVLAHNHPLGECKPSLADDICTAKLAILYGMNGVVFQDHLIVGKDDVYSYHVSGRMQNIRDDYDVSEIIRQKGIK